MYGLELTKGRAGGLYFFGEMEVRGFCFAGELPTQSLTLGVLMPVSIPGLTPLSSDLSGPVRVYVHVRVIEAF